MIQESFSKILDTDFSDGTLQCWEAQALHADSVTVVDDPAGGTGKAVKLHMKYSEDFSHMGYGNVPRAAIAYPENKLIFTNENTYYIKFKTFLPLDFQYDAVPGNTVAFYDQHTELTSGSTSNSLIIDKSNYIFNNSIDPTWRNMTKSVGATSVLGDLGRWVEWENYWRPSFSSVGRSAYWKDGKLVLDYRGFTGYQNVHYYQKFQVYKPLWKTMATSTTEEVIYIKDIKIYKGG